MKKSINVEELLRVKFEEIIANEKLDHLSPENTEAIIRAMRQANKIGYTNGYKSGVKVAK